MKHRLNKSLPELDEWFDSHPGVFQSEVEAFRSLLPKGEDLKGIEIGLGSGRLSLALGLKEGVESSRELRKLAYARGIDVMNATPEALPYSDYRFDFAIINLNTNQFKTLYRPFKEAHRILKNNGILLAGFIDSTIGLSKYFSDQDKDYVLREQLNDFSTEKVLFELSEAGFRHPELRQTLLEPLSPTVSSQAVKTGYGEGVFVVIKAMKKRR